MTSVYGFGSYFNDAGVYQDMDILIVHSSSEYRSCLEAISFKRAIVREISDADVSILSKSAESEFNFIEKSQAILLIEFYECDNKSALIELLRKVGTYKKT